MSPTDSNTREPVKLTTATGQIVLGSPHLTAGIPGDGPLTTDELQAWLADAANHAPIKFVLPAALASESANVVVPSDNELTLAKIELGRQLFFDKRLSGIGTFACATCHQPEQSYTSYHVMPEVDRNASTVFNRILGREHFWDGRASSLEAQPRSPIENPFEMNSSPEISTANIAAIPGYLLQFRTIFGSVTFENICKALACFERVLVTTDSAWDRGQLSASAQRGEELFMSDRLGCADCHSGRNLTDEDYHHLGVPMVGQAKSDGRYSVTRVESDRGAFKTPSLRNVANTPPYMHNGSLGTLEEVVDFFDAGCGIHNGSRLRAPLNLTDSDKRDLIAFLQSLTSHLPPVETGRLPQ